MDMFENRLIMDVAQWFWGGWDSPLQALVMLTVVEAFSSMILALYKRRCSGWRCLQAAARIMMMFLLVGTARVMDSWTGENGILRLIIVGYYLSYERNRILENATGIGLPVPWR